MFSADTACLQLGNYREINANGKFIKYFGLVCWVCILTFCMDAGVGAKQGAA